MWVRYGRLLALSLVLLLCSSWGFSEDAKTYTLTETELGRLEMIFETLRTENVALRSTIEGLQTDSEKLKTELDGVRGSLTRAEESLTRYADDMNKTLSTARTKTVIYTALGAIGGVLVGGITGYLIGVF